MKLGRATLLVRDYDEAIRYYCETLGFEVICDLSPAPSQRFVHLALPGQENMALWLLKAASEEQQARIGDQTAGFPAFVLYTDDIEADYQRLIERGIAFHVPLTTESGSRYAQFRDLYGNGFVIVQLLD